MVKNKVKHPVRIYHYSYDREKGGDNMLRYYQYVTRLRENLIQEGEECLARRVKLAKKVIKRVARRLDDLND